IHSGRVGRLHTCSLSTIVCNVGSAGSRLPDVSRSLRSSSMPADPGLYCSPVLVAKDGAGIALERVAITPGALGQFDEAWLQTLIHQNPNCLPIIEVDPGLGRFQAICREFPTPHGPIDNLLMTPAGDIALVETKLFRNP